MTNSGRANKRGVIIIELYLDSEKGSVGGNLSDNRALHRASAMFTPVKEPRVKMSFVDFSDREKAILVILERLVHRYGAEITVYDLARARYALRAFFKGIRKTPSVIIGGKRYTGEMTEAGLIAAFEAADV